MCNIDCERTRTFEMSTLGINDQKSIELEMRQLQINNPKNVINMNVNMNFQYEAARGNSTNSYEPNPN